MVSLSLQGRPVGLTENGLGWLMAETQPLAFQSPNVCGDASSHVQSIRCGHFPVSTLQGPGGLARVLGGVASPSCPRPQIIPAPCRHRQAPSLGVLGDLQP